MNLIKPKKLQYGDTIAIVALSGVVVSEENVFRAQKFFEDKGYKIVFAENIFDKKRYLAGTDEKKVEELHKFFKDPEVDMILCVRGGYGAIRLLDKIDFALIRKNPKIFAGYSDVSALNAMILKRAGLMTFSAPMAQSDFGVESVSEYTENNFFKALTSDILEMVPENENSKVYYEGEAKCTMWGGNLSTLVSLCGQEFIPDEKFIFFAEDLNEPVYKIDKMFTQLFNIEKFKDNIQGIVLGEFSGLDSDEDKKDFDDLFYEIGEKYKLPILSGFKIGHAKDKLTIAYGATAFLTTVNKKLTIKAF